jgi:hypothetical protein
VKLYDTVKSPVKGVSLDMALSPSGENAIIPLIKRK